MAQLAAGVARCRAAFEGDAVVDLEVVELNAAFCDLTSPAIVVGLRFTELAPGRAPDTHSILARATRVLATGGPERAEIHLAGRWLISTTYRLAADEVAIVLDDASRSKRAEQAGARSETRFAAAFRGNAAPLAISRCADLRVVDVNERLLELIGMPRDQVIGRTPAELGLTPPAYVHARVDELAAPGGGAARQHEVVITPPNGAPRILLASAQVIELDDEPCALTTFLDITERVEAARALRELNANLERRVAARTEALTASNRELEAFAHSVSHDLRTPLRAVNAFVEIVLDEHAAGLAPEVQLLLGRVRDSGRRMAAMIADLLALAQVGSTALRRRAIDVGALVGEVVDEVRRGRPDGARVEVRIAALPPCHADATLIRQVWVNLIDNAFKYAAGRAPPVIEITAERVGGQVVYAVRDNGVGFDPAHATRLFRAFQRLHRASEFEGVGLGLANVRRIIERHGGRVWADSTPEHGATFQFTLGEDLHDG